jgi:hypothetical protein
LLGGRSGTSAVASTVGRGRVLPGQDHPRGRRGVRHMDIFPGVDRGAAQLLARALGTATAARTGPTAGDPGLSADPFRAAAGLIPAAAWRGQAAGVAHMDRCVQARGLIFWGGRRVSTPVGLRPCVFLRGTVASRVSWETQAYETRARVRLSSETLGSRL